eukprot:UN04065
MMYSVRLAFLITMAVKILHVHSGQIANEDAYCSPPDNLPFDESEATRQMNANIDCWVEYWQEGNTYNGVQGFLEIFGNIDYIMNGSTEFEFDGTTFNTYIAARGRSVATHNFITVVGTAFEIKMGNSSEYELDYTYKVNMKLKIGNDDTEQEYTIHRIDTYFNDDSGICSKVWTKTTVSVMARILGQIIDTTVGFADALNLFDDQYDDYFIFYLHPITIVFIIVLILCT